MSAKTLLLLTTTLSLYGALLYYLQDKNSLTDPELLNLSQHFEKLISKQSNPQTQDQHLNFLQVSEKHIESAFIQFIANYGKTYASKSHHETKYQIFKDNFMRILNHNSKKDKSFEKGVNRFSDMSEEEFLKVYGTLQENGPEYEDWKKQFIPSTEEQLELSNEDERQFLQNDSKNHKFKLMARPHHFNSTVQIPDPEARKKKKKELSENQEPRYECNHDEESHNYFDYNDYKFIDSLPKCESINWVEKGFVGLLKDQSTCGSCWAHSTLASLESLYALENNITNRSEIPSFSEQQLVDCNFLPNLGCLGGKRQFAYNYTVFEGVSLASKYPYQNKQQECKYQKDSDKFYQIDAFKAYERMNTHDLEKLICKGVVSVSIRINDCIKNYKSGVLYDGDDSCGCSKKATNHAVAIVGFGRDEENTVCKDYWIIKNSWGPNWGEKGFMRLCREDSKLNFGTCSIRTEPMIPLRNYSKTQ